MKKWSALVLLFISFSVISILFNNCSESSNFSKSATSDSTGDGTSVLNGDNSNLDDSAGGSVTRDLTDNEIDDIISQIPQDQIDNPVPVTELQNDPTLYDTYMCGDGGVAICHFPDNVDAQGSKCIGRPAVLTHYNHLRLYDDNGTQRSIADYLGPCRVPLYQ